MQDFIFQNKTKVYFGKDQLKHLGEEVSRFGKKVLLVYLVNEKDGSDELTTHGVRYYDKYVKVNGKWKIAEREQYFVFSNTQIIEKES